MKISSSLLIASVSALQFIEIPNGNLNMQNREFFEAQGFIPVQKLLVAPVGGLKIMSNERQSKSTMYSSPNPISESEEGKNGDSNNDDNNSEVENPKPNPSPNPGSPGNPSKKKKRRFPFWPWRASHVRQQSHDDEFEYEEGEEDSFDTPASASHAFDEEDEFEENYHGRRHHGHHHGHHHHHRHHHGRRHHGHHHGHHHHHDHDHYSNPSSSIENQEGLNSEFSSHPLGSSDTFSSLSLPSSHHPGSFESVSPSPPKLLVDIIKIKEKVSESGEPLGTQVHNVILGTNSKDHKLHKLFTGDIVIKPIRRKAPHRSHPFSSEEFLKLFSSHSQSANSSDSHAPQFNLNAMHPMGSVSQLSDSHPLGMSLEKSKNPDESPISSPPHKPIDDSLNDGNDGNRRSKNQDFFDYIYRKFHLDRTSHRLVFSFAVGFLFTLMLYTITVLVCWFFGIDETDNDGSFNDEHYHRDNRKRDNKKKYSTLPQNEEKNDKKTKYEIQEIVVVNNKIDNKTKENDKLIETDQGTK